MLNPKKSGHGMDGNRMLVNLTGKLGDTNRSWLCEVFPGTPEPFICCKTIDEARSLAESHGFAGILV